MSGLPAQRPASIPDEAQRRSQLIRQALPVLLIPALFAAVAAIIARLTMQDIPQGLVAAAHTRPPVVVVTIALAVFFAAMILLVRLGGPTVKALLLIGAWTLITTLSTLRGGVASVGPPLLVIPICAAGLLIDGTASMSLAGVATVLVGALGYLERIGLYVVPVQQLPFVAQPFPLESYPLFAAGIWASLFWTVALLTSLLAGGLQRSLQQSRVQSQTLQELSDQLGERVAEQTAELAQRAARAEALYEVSRALTGTLDLNQVLGLITEQAARLLGFDSAQVLLQQPDGRFAMLGEYDPAARLAPSPADLEPLLSEVVERRQPRVGGPSLPPDANGAPANGVLMLPMCYRAGVAGVLLLTNADGSANVTDDDLILGQGLADQAAVAIANAQLLNRVRETATLDERTRLARDIHDTLAQGLAGVVVQLGATQRALAVAPDEASDHLALAVRMARESLAEARSSVWNLRPPALQRGGLGDALTALTVRPLGGNVAVTFEQRGEPWVLPSAAESTLLRVCQEALSNVTRHAQAGKAEVVLEYLPDRVSLSIHDDGIGFDEPTMEQTSPPDAFGGFGLVGMRERVAALGGTLQMHNEGGARIAAVIPRSEEAHRPAAGVSSSQIAPEAEG